MNEDQEFQEYEAFSKQMEAKFPKMYVGHYGGFAVGKGWWPIIEKLSSHIQSHIEFKAKQNEPINQVTVQQVKEKFGGLRFYYDGGDDYIRGLVSMAEAWAGTSCEDCGAPGKRTGGGWVRTLCDVHEIEREQRQAEFAKANGLEL
jgi:hypothetical protein